AYSVDNSLLFVLLYVVFFFIFFFFSSRRRHTRFKCDWSSDVCSSDLPRSPTAVVMQGMVGDRGVAGNQSQPKESLPATLVTPCPVGTCGRVRYLATVSTVFMTRSEERRVGEECT